MQTNVALSEDLLHHLTRREKKNMQENYYEKIKAHLTLDILNLRQEIKNLSLRHTRKDKTYYVME